MMTGVFSGMLREAVDGLRRELESPRSQPFRAWEVKDMLLLGATIRELFQQFKQVYLRQLSECVEATSFRTAIEPALWAAEAYLELEPSLRDLAANGVRGLPPNPDAAKELMASAEEVLDIRKELRQILELMARPFPALDPEPIERAIAACELGECESSDDIMARLEAGGEF